MNKFERLGVDADLLKIIKENFFEEPTEIQELAIPHILNGEDVIGESATGSGKTLAFGCGILQRLGNGKGIKALVLTPTREIAEQVKGVLQKFSANRRLKIVSVYGGVAIGPQISALGKADVVVGTPGRILDHIGRNTVNFSRLNILVLDEADRMLDMGFIEDVQKIIKECPPDRQTMLFSATISTHVKDLAKKYMRNPVRINANPRVEPGKLKQVYFDTPNHLKFSLLVHLLKTEKSGLVMVFCNTKKNVDFIATNLKKNGVNANAIHGGLTQARRLSILKKFHSKNMHVLVCTDVAARGLDIPHVSHVYNYDIPKDSKEYIHRIGRTARAGKEGIVINILTSRDHDNFSRVLRDHSDLRIDKAELPQVQKIAIKFSDDFRKRARSKGGFRGVPRGSPRRSTSTGAVRRSSYGGAPRGRPRKR